MGEKREKHLWGLYDRNVNKREEASRWDQTIREDGERGGGGGCVKLLSERQMRGRKGATFIWC